MFSHVGSVINDEYTCSKDGIVFCFTITVSHTKQWLPFVKPVWLQVGSTASSTTSVCPVAVK